jgi:histidinol-phosphate aminotransferase
MQKNPEQLVRPEILALKAYHVAEAEGMVKLDAMENPYRLSPEIRAELAMALADAEINRYPEPTGRRLRELLSRRMDVPAGMEILLGNGSDDLIQMVTFTLARPGATVMFVEPTFVMYRMNAVFSGMKPVGVPARADFSLDRDAFIAAIRKHEPALVFIAYPNNPTGALFDEEDVAAIIRATEGVVVLDEAYHVFAQKSFMSRLPEFSNLVVMRTVSKLGLAGIRLGYLAARPEWTVQFNKVRQAYNVSVLTQTAALYAMDRLEIFEAQADEIRKQFGVVKGGLEAMPGVTVFPSAANFFLVRVPDANRAFEGLRSRGVLVRNFNGAHPLMENCLRITVGTPEENRRLLTALREAL